MGREVPAEIRATIESLLFASSEPISLKALANLVGIPFEVVQETIAELRSVYNSPERGLQVVETAGGYQLGTKPEYVFYVARLNNRQRPMLSPAAMETLAVVAYHQPVTRADIEAWRGVKVDGVLGTLLDRGLVEDAGRSSAPGHPILYRTSKLFLKHFGLRDLSDLPPFPENVEG